MPTAKSTSTETKSTTTTGQAGAGAKLTTEQRTKVTTVIKQQNIQPVTNVNFSISVGTRCAARRSASTRLPAEIITVYPDWRGYELPGPQRDHRREPANTSILSQSSTPEGGDIDAHTPGGLLKVRPLLSGTLRPCREPADYRKWRQWL